MSKNWETYEEVATDLLRKFADEFGLEKVESKQKIIGLRSNTEWEIDAKGIAIKDGKIIIVECRRQTKSRVKQEDIGGLAYKITDTGSSGGIFITPIGFQEGAKKVTKSENITTVILHEDSSSSDYVLQFLNHIKVGASGTLKLSGKLSAKFIQGDGTTKDLGEL